MNFSDLVDELHQLSRVDKLRIIQLLATDLATEESYLTSKGVYEVWSPLDSPDAAQTLLKMLDKDEPQDG